MSYVESRSWTQGWKLVLGLFIFIVVLSVLFGRSRPVGPADIAAALEANAQIRETNGALLELYPRDHARLVERLSDTLQRGGNSATADWEAGAFMRGFLADKADAIVSAPDADLRAMASADLAVARLLQRSDVALCAAFMDNGIPPGSHPSADALALIDHASALRLRAAYAGENSHRAPRARLSGQDSRAWLERLDANDPASAALVRGGWVEHSRAPQQCAAGIAVYQAALDLPPPQSGQVIANMFRSALTG